MSEGNGKLEQALALKAKIEAMERKGQDMLLEPWKSRYPRLRSLLLGLGSDAVEGLRINLSFQVSPGVLEGKLHQLDLGYIARYLGSDIDSILESMDTDLDTGRVPWVPDYGRQSKQRNALKSL